MGSNLKGSAHRGRFSFFHAAFASYAGSRSLGYTLIEMLTAMLIAGVLASVFTVFYRGLPAPNQSPEKEAQKLSRWLTNLVTISNRSGRPFSLNCPGNATRGFIEATWQSPLKKDTYTSAYGCKFNRYTGNNVDSLYVPQWSAMVPTITIKVSRERAEHYVIVSQHGRVRANKLPASVAGE